MPSSRARLGTNASAHDTPNHSAAGKPGASSGEVLDHITPRHQATGKDAPEAGSKNR